MRSPHHDSHICSKLVGLFKMPFYAVGIIISLQWNYGAYSLNLFQHDNSPEHDGSSVTLLKVGLETLQWPAQTLSLHLWNTSEMNWNMCRVSLPNRAAEWVQILSHVPQESFLKTGERRDPLHIHAIGAGWSTSVHKVHHVPLASCSRFCLKHEMKD